MSPEQDFQEIQKRVRMFEDENARLRQMAKTGASHQLRVIEGEYKGHSILTFDGPCCPFTLGLAKLRVLKEALPQIEEFLKRHSTPRDDGDDDKI